MIDFETVRFTKMLDELAALTASDIKPFSEATQESWRSRECLFYDDKTLGFPIVCDALIDELHHDIISYYSGEDFTVKLICEDDDEPFIEVMSADKKYAIVVEDGAWYFV